MILHILVANLYHDIVSNVRTVCSHEVAQGKLILSGCGIDVVSPQLHTDSLTVWRIMPGTKGTGSNSMTQLSCQRNVPVCHHQCWSTMENWEALWGRMTEKESTCSAVRRAGE